MNPVSYNNRIIALSKLNSHLYLSSFKHWSYFIFEGTFFFKKALKGSIVLEIKSWSCKLSFRHFILKHTFPFVPSPRKGCYWLHTRHIKFFTACRFVNIILYVWNYHTIQIVVLTSGLSALLGSILEICKLSGPTQSNWIRLCVLTKFSLC
jgi:hypothetical protein